MPQPAKTYNDVRDIIFDIQFKDRTFKLIQKGDGFLLQVRYWEKDIHTKKPALQRARKWYISPFSTTTEIVETAFKALRVSNDHVLKEGFLFKGRRVYSPHFDIEARIELCDGNRFDRRED